MNFSPEMLNSFKNMINPQMVRDMGDKVNGMSDDQLRAFLVSMGMGHISPQAYRGMFGQMKNMSDNDIENLKNKADTNKFNSYNRNPPNFNSNSTSPNTSNKNTDEKDDGRDKKKENIDNNLDDFLCNDKAKIALKKLENIKNEGNTFFKSSKFQEACEKYYEVLNELDYLARDQDLKNNLTDIEKLENTCRLNIATSKLKTNDNDLAINECLKIIRKNATNIKAHYKAGCGYINKKNFEKALYHFEKVREINPEEEIQQVKTYINECKKHLKSQEDYIQKDNIKNENNNLETKDSNDNKINNEEKTQSNKIKNESEIKNDNEYKRSESEVSSKKDKLKEVLEREIKYKEKEPEIKKTKVTNEIIIEDNTPRKDEKLMQNTQNKTSTNNYNSYSNIPINNLDPTKINEAKEKIKNMDNEQLNGISSMFKNMDNNMIKSVYQMQGMNITDEQINFMKNNMNPDLMKMAVDMNPSAPIPSSNNSNNTTENKKTNLNNESYDNVNNSNNNISVSNQNQQQPVNFPFGNGNLPNMDMKSMMDFISKNPNIMNMMGPQMSQMFGNVNGMDQNLMMNSMQTILWFMSIPTRIKQFFSSTQGKILILCLLFLIIAYFFR